MALFNKPWGTICSLSLCWKGVTSLLLWVETPRDQNCEFQDAKSEGSPHPAQLRHRALNRFHLFSSPTLKRVPWSCALSDYPKRSSLCHFLTFGLHWCSCHKIQRNRDLKLSSGSSKTQLPTPKISLITEPICHKVSSKGMGLWSVNKVNYTKITMNKKKIWSRTFGVLLGWEETERAALRRDRAENSGFIYKNLKITDWFLPNSNFKIFKATENMSSSCVIPFPKIKIYIFFLS